ncbi:FG-GAP-like repeat-containing protein [Streptomyces yaanensis]|uniref:FG-GAP-like repeat-containing protein n=1 Tax=Streptomyces yaanensis TaxID=1142239 RepID=A0ABV7SG26_9ACTN|nr:FG-GAP-like repeat-containing protein [Streptomyces sp. CGMCC 4.7035]WNB97493.1 FG-GAP-like repeat-containing protein [Streptomyces sp. CGMCC 4.7035]
MLRISLGRRAPGDPSSLRRTAARRTLGAALALAASMTTAVTMAPQAAAADNSDRCPSGKLCLFQYGDYKGEMKIVSSSLATMGDFNDKTSSLVNNSRMWAVAHTKANYAGGDTLLIGPHNGAIDLTGGAFDGAFDNKISSIRVATTEYEATQGVPWMDWYLLPEDKRPAGLPDVARFGDLNNDGRPDLLERADDGRLWFLSGIVNADGSTKGKLVGGGWNAMTQLVRHGDYNGDAKEDLYARDKAGVLWFYPGRGNGTFGTRVRVGGGWNALREISAAGDLTGDGHRDLLARDTAGKLWLYPGNGKGAFRARKLVGGGWNAMNKLAAPGDMTGDGKADLLARDGSRALWLYPGNGNGAFGARKKLPYAWPSDEPVIATGDVNGDGLSDLMRPINFQLFVYHGNGRGSISGPDADMGWDTAPNVRVF